ncbi:MAG: lipocalin family protein [Planctomycetota bacterium]
MPLLAPSCTSHPPLPTVAQVDLPRFMGAWFVIGHVPAGSEAAAHNAVESYQLLADGTIATTYAFRDGGFDGELRVMEPSAVVWDRRTNAEWGMRFFWPLRFEYRITWLDADYQTTIVARSARDYAWIMARRPHVDDATWQELTAALVAQGYAADRLRRVPHRWPDPGHPFAGAAAAAHRSR